MGSNEQESPIQASGRLCRQLRSEVMPLLNVLVNSCKDQPAQSRKAERLRSNCGQARRLLGQMQWRQAQAKLEELSRELTEWEISGDSLRRATLSAIQTQLKFLLQQLSKVN